MNKDTIQSILDREAEAVRNIPVSEEYERAVELIVHHVHERGGKLITSGMGKAGQIAMNIATTFSSTGTPAFFLHPSEAQHGDLGIIQKNDVMLLISNSGKTRELEELVPLMRGLVPDMPFILITGNPDRPADRLAGGSLPPGIDTDHIHYGDDRYRRYPRRRHDAAHRLHQHRICKKTPRRLSRR